MAPAVHREKQGISVLRSALGGMTASAPRSLSSRRIESLSNPPPPINGPMATPSSRGSTPTLSWRWPRQVAQRVDQGDDLGCQAAARAPDRLILSPAHMGSFGSRGQIQSHINKAPIGCFGIQRSEPECTTWSFPHQINLTFGRRSQRLHQYPTCADGAQENEAILFLGFLGHGGLRSSTWIRQD
jgi:hypothetical protein